MAKTYNTIPTVSTGDVYAATAHNNIVTNVNNYRVPPACIVYRSSDLSSYASGTAITWNAEQVDTDSMFSASSTNVTVGTTGLYAVSLQVYLVCTATLTLVDPAIKVGSTVALENYGPAANTAAGINQTHGILSLTAGDVITCLAYITGGSNYTIKGNADPQNSLITRFAMTWLGQVS